MPVYEYRCQDHGVFGILNKKIPEQVPVSKPCPICGNDSVLIPSLGFYGDAVMGTWGKLSRERKRYHERAPEREAELRKQQRHVTAIPS